MKQKNLQDSISNLRSQIAQLEDEVRIVGGGLRYVRSLSLTSYHPYMPS